MRNIIVFLAFVLFSVAEGICQIPKIPKPYTVGLCVVSDYPTETGERYIVVRAESEGINDVFVYSSSFTRKGEIKEKTRRIWTGNQDPTHGPDLIKECPLYLPPPPGKNLHPLPEAVKKIGASNPNPQ